MQTARLDKGPLFPRMVAAIALESLEHQRNERIFDLRAQLRLVEWKRDTATTMGEVVHWVREGERLKVLLRDA